MLAWPEILAKPQKVNILVDETFIVDHNMVNSNFGINNICVPSVSVIIPTRNRATLLHRAINSVLVQTCTDLELIVIDDASTDNTQEMLHDIKDERVRVIRLEASRGACVARNVGIAHSRGQYIAFQDDDDEWFPEKLERQVEIFQKSGDDVGVVSCGFWIDQEGRRTYFPYKRFRIREGSIYRALIWENFHDTPSLLIKKRYLEESKLFDESLPRFQDWDLCLRLSQCCLFGFVDSPLYVKYCQKHSISTNSVAGLTALRIIIEKNREAIDSDKRLAAHFSQWLGMFCVENGKMLDARNHFRKAVTLHPISLKYYVTYLLSLGGCGLFHAFVGLFIKIKNR